MTCQTRLPCRQSARLVNIAGIRGVDRTHGRAHHDTSTLKRAQPFIPGCILCSFGADHTGVGGGRDAFRSSPSSISPSAQNGGSPNALLKFGSLGDSRKLCDSRGTCVEQRLCRSGFVICILHHCPPRSQNVPVGASHVIAVAISGKMRVCVPCL